MSSGLSLPILLRTSLSLTKGLHAQLVTCTDEAMAGGKERRGNLLNTPANVTKRCVVE